MTQFRNHLNNTTSPMGGVSAAMCKVYTSSLLKLRVSS